MPDERHVTVFGLVLRRDGDAQSDGKRENA
jgi:hypothetical protein